jgi:hypothetical protein
MARPQPFLPTTTWNGRLFDGAIDVIEAHLVPVDGRYAPWNLLESCDAITFGVQTYMGEQLTQFKAFQDATSREVFAAGSPNQRGCSVSSTTGSRAANG